MPDPSRWTVPLKPSIVMLFQSVLNICSKFFFLSPVVPLIVTSLTLIFILQFFNYSYFDVLYMSCLCIEKNIVVNLIIWFMISDIPSYGNLLYSVQVLRVRGTYSFSREVLNS